MAAFHGKGGTITFTGIDPALVLSWTLDATCDMADGTDMAQATKIYFAGLKNWTASVEALADSGGLEGELGVLGSSATLTLQMVSGKTIAGTAICTGFDPTVSIDGAVTVTYSFQGSGTLS